MVGESREAAIFSSMSRVDDNGRRRGQATMSPFACRFATIVIMSEVAPAPLSRRGLLQSAAVASAGLLAGCIAGESGQQQGRLEKVWGIRGTSPGRLNKPRAVTIDKDDLLYIVDVTPQIQVFTGDGKFLRGWQTPDFKHGKPSGLSFDNEGNLLV